MAPTVVKTLDAKLARIVADPDCRDFILADAKDADMAIGGRHFQGKVNDQNLDSDGVEWTCADGPHFFTSAAP